MKGKFLLIATSLVLALSTNIVLPQQALAKESTTQAFKTKRGASIKTKNGALVQSKSKNFHKRG